MRKLQIPSKYYDAADAFRNFKDAQLYLKLLYIPAFFIGHDVLRNPENFRAGAVAFFAALTLIGVDQVLNGNRDQERHELVSNNASSELFQSRMNKNLFWNTVLLCAQAGQVLFFNQSQLLPLWILFAFPLTGLALHTAAKRFPQWKRSVLCTAHAAFEISVSLSALLFVFNLPILSTCKVAAFLIEGFAAFLYYRLISNPVLGIASAENQAYRQVTY